MGTLSMTGRCGSAAAREAEFFRGRGHTPAPQFIQWMATLQCPMSCAHCLAAGDAGEGSEAAPDMALADVERLLDEVAAMGIPEFLVTGGEPAARPDLAEVVALLAERVQRWSLNTAALPDARTRAAMAKWPPSFVAVSLDGPERVHDRFRGRPGAWRDALEAIRFYRSVVRGEVVAGTTVTRANFAHLDETFGLVAASGATSWGLHLLVPEGRAARRPELFLRRRELRALLDFCAARRKYFPVGMADEIGYLGAEGPLVRDAPFFCGAGRTQCVVLPDGEVVPCTTLDRSASAGNVLRDSLEKIWAEGFKELRAWEPEGACGSCEYARACRGGCWLQRRSGRHCSRHLWRSSRLAATAAGMAVALGLGCARGAEPGEAPQKPPVREDVEVPSVTRSGMAGTFRLDEEARAEREKERKRRQEELARRQKTGAFDWTIAQWLAAKSQLYNRRSPSEGSVRKSVEEAFGEEPAGLYFIGFIDPERDRDLASRCEAVQAGLKTEQVSLSLAALMWRDLTEACLDGTAPEKRTEEDRKLLRKTMAALGSRSRAWQRQIFEERLGPFLDREVRRHAFGGKAGPPGYVRLRWHLRRNRWGDLSKVTEEYVAVHPFGGSMSLRATCDEGAGLARVSGGDTARLAGEFTLGIFDVLRVLAARVARLEISVGKDKLTVNLSAGSDVTYADVLRLAYEQNREALDARIETAGPGSLRRGASAPSPLLLPALRALEADLAGKEDEASRKLIQVRWLLEDIWLF